MTENFNTKLISIRIENTTIKAIDKFKEGHLYSTRSSIINQALIRLFRDYDEQAIYNFLYHHEPLK